MSENQDKTMTEDAVVQRAALQRQLEEAKALQNAQIIVVKTEEGRHLLAYHIRLLETLINGKPSTPMPTRHHV